MIGSLLYGHVVVKTLWSTAKKCTEIRAASAARLFFVFLTTDIPLGVKNVLWLKKV